MSERKNVKIYPTMLAMCEDLKPAEIKAKIIEMCEKLGLSVGDVYKDPSIYDRAMLSIVTRDKP